MGMMRRRRRRRVIVAGAAAGAAVHHARKRNAQEDEYAAEPDQAEAAVPEQSTGPDATDLEEIQKLAGLHESGALTDEEFAAAKAKLLA